jgi:hypothetical protein
MSIASLLRSVMWTIATRLRTRMNSEEGMLICSCDAPRLAHQVFLLPKITYRFTVVMIWPRSKGLWFPQCTTCHMQRHTHLSLACQGDLQPFLCPRWRPVARSAKIHYAIPARLSACRPPLSLTIRRTSSGSVARSAVMKRSVAFTRRGS